MRRWIRRILMVGSVGLMVIAVAMAVRAVFVYDVLFVHAMGFGNERRGVLLVSFGEVPRTWLVETLPPKGTFRWLRPRISVNPANGITYMRLPHWFLFVTGSIYPAIVLVGWRRRKKTAGFPV